MFHFTFRNKLSGLHVRPNLKSSTSAPSPTALYVLLYLSTTYAPHVNTIPTSLYRYNTAYQYGYITDYPFLYIYIYYNKSLSFTIRTFILPQYSIYIYKHCIYQHLLHDFQPSKICVDITFPNRIVHTKLCTSPALPTQCCPLYLLFRTKIFDLPTFFQKLYALLTSTTLL